MVNLADFYRTQNRDDQAEPWLQKAIAAAPNAAEPIHALGLLKIRQKDYAAAMTLLERAAKLAPQRVHYSYVYAVALNSTGRPDEAISVLQQAHQRRPADREILFGLVAFERDKGNLSAATEYAHQLVLLAPEDPEARATLTELEGQAH